MGIVCLQADAPTQHQCQNFYLYSEGIHSPSHPIP